MTKRCYYETLECQKGATVETLKASYRKLAMKFHPDQQSRRRHRRSQIQGNQRSL